MPANQELVLFIAEARKRGFDDSQIKDSLLRHNWPLAEINAAFNSLKITASSGPKYQDKNRLTVYLGNDVLKALEKRAKKNMFNLHEQVEDILRRSCTRAKQAGQDTDKIDDMFVKVFSRKSCGRPRGS